jgi:spore coat protein U-like protein
MKGLVSLCALLVSMVCASHAWSQERVAGLEVSASVGVRCKVESRGDIAFGALDPAQAINTFATTEARVACTRNYDTDRSTRQMISERGASLPYKLSVESGGGIGEGWFQPSITRLAASVQGSDYVDLPGGHYQDVIRISVEY